MQMAAFNAVCPYEIGDKVKVAIPAQGEDGQMFSVEVATITVYSSGAVGLLSEPHSHQTFNHESMW